MIRLGHALIIGLSFLKSPMLFAHADEDHSVKLSPAALAKAELGFVTASRQSIPVLLEASGIVVPNGYQTVAVKPRYSGVASEVLVNVGSHVLPGQKLAMIQANGSETSFNVTASIKGVVTEKKLVQGQFVSSGQAIFVISNLDRVWVQLSVKESDRKNIRVGQKVEICDFEGQNQALETVAFVGQTVLEDTQSLPVRVDLPNPSGKWQPGIFVKAKIFTPEITDSIVVQNEAIQMLGGFQAVFLQKSEGQFLAQKIELGRQGTGGTEVLHGLRVGDIYVSKNSYLLKAELYKGEAEHDH